MTPLPRIATSCVQRGVALIAASALAALSIVAGGVGRTDRSRDDRNLAEPEPAIVAPGVVSKDAAPTPPPSDAVVLFDGTSLDRFRDEGNQPARWSIDAKPGGAMTIQPGTGGIFSTDTFGDAQVHIEFATPEPAAGEGQDRGNSGVYIQGRYEVQILDSYRNSTYPNGQCGAIYAQHAPLANACRAPGEWQTYDIVFRAARFDDAGVRTERARLTVLHNGVLIHDHALLDGETTAAPRKEGTGDGPIYLQDHGHAVRYRHIWVRRLGAP